MVVGKQNEEEVGSCNREQKKRSWILKKGLREKEETRKWSGMKSYDNIIWPCLIQGIVASYAFVAVD